MKKVKSLLNKMSSPMRPPAGLGDLRLTKLFVSKVFSLFITTQSAEDSRQRRSGMTALFDVKAFTLVELLVVVLIIGVLSAIAIPMYQGAVDKSHWSTMLPASKAIKDAEEAFKMTNGEYSNTMEHLDVQMNNSDLTFTLSTPNTLADPNVIRVTNNKLGDRVRLASYLDDSPKFAGQLHCEAKNEGSAPNERGQRLCEKLLNGQYLKTTDDGYTRYLLDQTADKATCGAATGSWSTSKNKCYNTTAERCEELGMGVVASLDDQCGYEDDTGGKPVEAEGVCVGDNGYGPCSYITINDGGICESSKDTSACYHVTVNQGGICTGTGGHFCGGATINGGACINNGNQGCNSVNVSHGGVCVANKVGDYGNGGCFTSHFSDHSICYANVSGSCSGYSAEGIASYYDETSCCCGTYCPAAAPSCASRGVSCDPYYMDKNNFLD